mgnify:CR=1 FL=1
MIGILIISHGNLGDSLIHCADHVMGQKSPYLTHLSVSIRDDPDAVVSRALELVNKLDCGNGVLVFSDICGATPCNIASRLVNPGKVRTRMRAQAYPGEDPMTVQPPSEVAEAFVALAEPSCRRHGEVVQLR